MKIEERRWLMSQLGKLKEKLSFLKGWLLKFLKGWPSLIMLYLGVAVTASILCWLYIKPSNTSERKDIIQTIAQVWGALALAITFYFSWRNLKLTQETTNETLKNTQVNLRLSQEEQITNLLTKAIEQLGSNSLAIRLGGVYGLERIARDSERDHWPIMEILTAYIREHSPWETDGPGVSQVTSNSATQDFTDGIPPFPKLSGERDQKQFLPPNLPPLPKDIQAILTVLGRRNLNFEKGRNQRLDLTQTNLRQAQLSETSFKRANLWGAHLERAQLICADFEEASFTGAHLEEAICSNANLKGASFSWARLNDTQLNIAHLEGADLSNAIGLTQEQIQDSFTDDETKLPNNPNFAQKAS
ncbi:MAG: pentapeptide repeat-containing protein [Acidobacteriota bacterium]|nr:pentapeptide repeat-containing protein [Acidobacteriota bacterium]